MKITIEIDEAQVKGITEYLKEVGEIEKPKKSDIAKEISGIVHTYLDSPQVAIADYINKHR